MSIEAINWMQSHTLEDLREITVDTEERGGDASTLKRLLTNLEQMQFAMMKPSQADIEFEEHHHVMARYNLRPMESFD